MQTFSSPSMNALIPAAIATVIAYAVYVIVYNLYFHPLSRFPGPRVAAVTTYWKGYVECVANRSFCHELVGLHAKYGEITIW